MINQNDSKRYLKENIVLQILEGFSNFINRISTYLVAVLLSAMCIIVLLQVFCRFILNNALPWPEEISRYIMIWVCFLGSGIACKSGEHISVSFIRDRFPKKFQYRLSIIINISILVFLSVCVWKGLFLMQFNKGQIAPASQISMFWAYSSVPVGSFIMMIHIFVFLFKEITGN